MCLLGIDQQTCTDAFVGTSSADNWCTLLGTCGHTDHTMIDMVDMFCWKIQDSGLQNEKLV